MDQTDLIIALAIIRKRNSSLFNKLVYFCNKSYEKDIKDYFNNDVLLTFNSIKYKEFIIKNLNSIFKLLNSKKIEKFDIENFTFIEKELLSIIKKNDNSITYLTEISKLYIYILTLMVVNNDKNTGLILLLIEYYYCSLIKKFVNHTPNNFKKWILNNFLLQFLSIKNNKNLLNLKKLINFKNNNNNNINYYLLFKKNFKFMAIILNIVLETFHHDNNMKDIIHLILMKIFSLCERMLFLIYEEQNNNKINNNNNLKSASYIVFKKRLQYCKTIKSVLFKNLSKETSNRFFICNILSNSFFDGFLTNFNWKLYRSLITESYEKEFLLKKLYLQSILLHIDNNKLISKFMLIKWGEEMMKTNSK